MHHHCRTNLNMLRDLQRRLHPIYADEGSPPYYPIPFAHIVTGIDDEEDGCEGPHWTLEMSWATSVIKDRVYAPRAEPVVNWKFNIIGRPGLVLTVTPVYEPRERHIHSLITPIREGDNAGLFTPADAEEHHRMFYGTSNWAATSYFLLRVLDPATHQTVRGYLETMDYAYTHMLDPDLAQPVLDTLWAATKGDARAFAGATRCAFCAHRLTDALSSARGYGPDCAKRYGLPWLQVLPSSRSASQNASEGHAAP